MNALDRLPEQARHRQHFDLRARFLVEGLMSGRHRSPYRGFSVEFVEHRRYAQGDYQRVYRDLTVYAQRAEA